MRNSCSVSTAGFDMIKGIIRFFAAALLYCAFAVYLYQPHLGSFDRFQYALVVSVTAGAVGCFLLSRRWTASFFGSFFAGAIYGFGPFMLGLAGYHPTASVLAASIPWFFLPAGLWPRGKLRALRAVLSLLPFAGIVAFFQAAEYLRFYPVSKSTAIETIDLVGLLSALVAAKRGLVLIGFYHIPIAALIIGIAMLIKARRLGTIAIIIASIAGSFFAPVLSVSPFMWFSIAAVCFSIIAGAGIDGLSLAGAADRKWILAAVIVMLSLSIVTLLLASKYFQTFAGLGAGCARLFVESARMYILGAVATGILFFMARAQKRLTFVRLILLSCAVGVDIFVCAQYIVDGVV